ncbi:MAG: FkbM family methyltransferase [Solirubrobacteraceae bacterium]
MIDALVRPGDAVVDAGANWGLYAARLAQLVGRAGQVDAFEPHPSHAGTLRALAARRPQLAAHELALSDTAGSATLHVPIIQRRGITALASLHAPRAGLKHEAITVPVATLDAALAGRRPPSFVKVDVEGMELAMLRGAEQTLRAARPTLIVEIEQRHQVAPIAVTFAYLEALGYVGHFFGARGLAPLADFDVERDQLRHLGQATPEYGMPAGYVADFLFADPALDVPGSLARMRHAI